MILYMKYFSIHLKSQMQYKASFFLSILSQFVGSFVVFLEIYFMFYKIHKVDNFTYESVLFCFSIVLMAYAIAECFARGFDLFPNMISNGEFDRVLVRPVNEIFQILCTKMNFASLGRFFQSAIILIYAIYTVNINWEFSKVILVLLMIICGSFLFASLFLIAAGVAFFTIEGIEFMNIFTDGGREFGKYPVSIYGSKILTILTYIVPIALIQYYPLLYILDMDKSLINYIAPILSLFFLIPAYLFWRFSTKYYTSTGS